MLAPCLVWSLFYLLARRVTDPVAIGEAILVGGGSAQMYYLLVYMQLVLVTPLLYRILDGGKVARLLLYAVTPALLVLRYALGLLGLGQMHLGVFCGTWLVYYLLGLEWRDCIEPWLRARAVRMGALVIALLVCLLAQEAEGFSWLAFGDYDLATTQLKLSAMAASCAFALIAMYAPRAVRGRVASCAPLVALGDHSFGVYLCHIAAVMVFSKVFSALGLGGIGVALVQWLLVLAASVAVVSALRRILPRRVLGWIGFE